MKRVNIYKYTSRTTGKSYVGQTHRSLKARANSKEGSGYKGCRVFWRAIKKYGWDDFEAEILLVCNADESGKKEDEMIDKYNTLVPNGYNLKYDNDKGGKAAESTKRRIKEAKKRKREAKGAVDGVTKLCNRTTCENRGKALPISCFAKGKGSWDGLQHQCRECMARIQRRYVNKKKKHTQLYRKTPIGRRNSAMTSLRCSIRNNNPGATKQELEDLCMKSAAYKKHKEEVEEMKLLAALLES